MSIICSKHADLEGYGKTHIEGAAQEEGKRTQIETGSTSITLILVGIDVIADFFCQPVSGSYPRVEDNIGSL